MPILSWEDKAKIFNIAKRDYPVGTLVYHPAQNNEIFKINTEKMYWSVFHNDKLCLISGDRDDAYEPDIIIWCENVFANKQPFNQDAQKIKDNLFYLSKFINDD